MRRFIPIFGFIVLGLVFIFGLSQDPSKLDSVKTGKSFPQFTLSALDDETILQSETMLEGQVSLVNVFGSWCVACTVEHPILMQIAQSDPTNIIGINWRDSRKKGQNWLSRHGDPYKAVIFDPESVLAIKLGVVGAPESFIVDKAGIIRYKHIGPISPEDWRGTLQPLIKTLEAQ